MSDSIDIDTEALNQNNTRLQRRASVRDMVNETVERSWRSVTTGLGKILETKFTNTLVIILLAIDISIVVADLLVKLYRREYPEHYDSLNKTDNILHWIIFGLRTFYLVMIVVRVCSYGIIYLADPLNFFDALIVILSGVFYYIFNERDKVMASFFILCRFWRINRVLEFTEQIKRDRHQENYQRLQRRLTTRLADERDLNAKLRQELQANDHSLNILMGGDLVTNKDVIQTKPAKKGIKFADEVDNDTDNKRNTASSTTNNKRSSEFNYLSDFESYFHF